VKNKIDIESEIKFFLQNRSEINFAYIFGSFIHGDKYNDIDIAVFVDPKTNIHDTDVYPFGYEAQILGQLSLILKTDRIDLILLNKANLFARVQVYNTGQLLFEKDRFFRIRVENSARKEYIDTNHFRSLITNNLGRILNVR